MTRLEEMLSRLGKRDSTMTCALLLLERRGGHRIVETGCARQPDNWDGDGMSTLVFAEWAMAHGGFVDSVDSSQAAVELCWSLLGEDRLRPFAGRIALHCGDSVEYLQANDWPIDLLYLDSLDYPLGALRDCYGGREDIERATTALAAMTEAQIVAAHHELLAPSQEHARNELAAALPQLGPGALVLIDDAGLPGGGKARLARQLLAAEGWECLAHDYQTLWSKPTAAEAAA